jgi:hypothetical protein
MSEEQITEPESVDHPPPPGRSRWHALLIVPVVVPLLTFLYNAKDPYFLGFPRFYWLQLAFILIGVGTTTLVYQMTKDPRPGGGASTAKHRGDRS